MPRKHPQSKRAHNRRSPHTQRPIAHPAKAPTPEETRIARLVIPEAAKFVLLDILDGQDVERNEPKWFAFLTRKGLLDASLQINWEAIKP